jgi:tungstate transport system substrate-binding protein
VRRLVVLTLVALAAGCADSGRVLVAAGTTVVDSGLIDALVEAYEDGHPDVELSVVGRATLDVLELGARGEADVLITHAPQLEADYLAEHGGRATALFSSSFHLVGPADRASELDGRTAAAAFGEIAARGWAFVTRADGSGTYERERAIWDAAGIDPDGAEWYAATGQGMGFSLQVADQREAFILVEAGTMAVTDAITLRAVALIGADEALVNPYTAIVPEGAPSQAAEFVAWLVSPEGRGALEAANAELFDSAVYRPPGA